MAPRRLAAAGVAAMVLMGTMQAAAQYPQFVQINPDPVKAAKAIVKKIQSTGGPVTYHSGAEVHGIVNGVTSDGNTMVDVALQWGAYEGASVDLTPEGKGIAFATIPVYNLQWGGKDMFDMSNPNGANSLENNNEGIPGSFYLRNIDPLYIPPTYRSGSYSNYVVVDFKATVPVGDLTMTYTFCTSRATPGSSIWDLFGITIEGDTVTFPEQNIAVLEDSIQGEVPITPTYVNNLQPEAPANWGAAANAGLSSNITFCLTNQETKTISITEEGVYRFRITTSQQNGMGAGTLALAEPTWAFIAADYIGDLPDVYDPTGDKLTSVDDLTPGTQDTWCVIGNSDTLDFVPGFRMEGANGGDGNKYCCRVRGVLTNGGTTCSVSFCGNPPTDYTEFVKDAEGNYDCWADCLLRDAFIGNDPPSDLQPNFLGLYDDRDEDIVLYQGAPITSDVTIIGGVDVDGVRTYANRKFVLAWDDFKASTGIGLQTPTTEYVCVKRGVITSGGNCLIGCDEITEDYLAVGTAVGDRCFTECWYKLDDA